MRSRSPMNSSVRPAQTALAALVALATLAGCAGGTDPAGTVPDGSQSGSPTPSVTADATLAAAVPEEIRERGTLRIGTNASYPPAEFVADDGTTLIGYDMDLARAVAARLGLTADIQNADFTAIIPGIGTKYDLGIGAITITAERLTAVSMVEYFTAGEAFAVPAGNPKSIDPDDLCGLTVGVQTGTVEDEELDDMSAACTKADKDAINKLQYPQQSDVTSALVGGKADVMFADSPVIGYAVAQTAGQLEQLGEVIARAPHGIAIASDDTQLADAVAGALQSLIDDGTYASILDTWGVADGAVDAPTLNPDVD